MKRKSLPADAAAGDAGWLCLGVVGKPKGVRGAVRVTTFTARPEDLAAYGPLHHGPGGPALAARLLETGAGGVVAAFEGIDDRDAAAALRGVRLYVSREALPETAADEYYHADLIGLAVVSRAGASLGSVTAVHDFGAGDVIEVAPAGGGETLLLPFTRDVVVEVDTAGGRLVVAPPVEDQA